MNEAGLRSMSTAARELGIRRETIGDLVKKLQIHPLRMSNGKAKGLTDSHMKALRKALGMAKATA